MNTQNTQNTTILLLDLKCFHNMSDTIPYSFLLNGRSTLMKFDVIAHKNELISDFYTNVNSWKHRLTRLQRYGNRTIQYIIKITEK